MGIEYIDTLRPSDTQIGYESAIARQLKLLQSKLQRLL
jgi:hypothetical protein